MKVLITRKLPQTLIDSLEKIPNVQIDYRQGSPLSKTELLKAVKDVDILVPVIPDKIDADIILAGKKLKLVATYSVGFDHIDIATATAHKIYVSNTPGNLTESVAEHTMALMFAVSRQINEADTFVRLGEYRYWDPMIFMGPQMFGKTLGIVGFGRIGQHLANIAHRGLGMKIMYSDPARCDQEKNFDAHFCPLDELLSNSDFVSLNCNLTEQTRHLIGERELKLMKPTAYLINTARGPLINELALVTALNENWIAGAGLDVFENEPQVTPDLVKLKNVVLTPHIGSATREARIQMANMVVANILEVARGNAPINWVNKF